MTNKRLYLAGPITGNPDYKAQFMAWEEFFKERGYSMILNPVEHPKYYGESDGMWLYYMRQALKSLAKADEIFMLPGWEQSKGASLEHHIAWELGLSVMYGLPNEEYTSAETRPSQEADRSYTSRKQDSQGA